MAQEALDGVVDEEELASRPEGEDDVGGVVDEVAVSLLGHREAVPEIVALRPQPLLVEGVLHTLDEFVVLEGLPEVVVGPSLQGLHGRLDGGMARHHDDRHVGIPVLDEIQQVESVHLRHHEVEEHQVAPVVLQPGHGSPRRGARLDAVVSLPEKNPDALAHPDLVVNNQNAGGSRHGLLRFMLFSRTRSGGSATRRPFPCPPRSRTGSFRPGPSRCCERRTGRDPNGPPLSSSRRVRRGAA